MSNGRPLSRAYYNATQTQYSLKDPTHDHRLYKARDKFKVRENTHDFTEYLRYESDYSLRVEDPDTVTAAVLHYMWTFCMLLEYNIHHYMFNLPFGTFGMSLTTALVWTTQTPVQLRSFNTLGHCACTLSAIFTIMFNPLFLLFTFLVRENTHDFTEYLRYESDYRPRVENPDPSTAEVLRYTRALRMLLEAPPTTGVVPAPSEILPGVYLGTVSHAENIKLLNKMGISYILNCAGIPCLRPQRQERYSFRPDIDIRGYEELPAEDTETYDITHHFPKAFRFIDASRRQGRVLIYCPDVNRSGAVAIGYLVNKGEALLEAARVVKDRRKGALFNRGFMKQLAQYARDHGQLEHKVPYLGMQQRVRVKDRPRNSHLLKFF